ncbi:MAG: hypothetical protein A2Y67_00590 [Candidatus Buchananbacteria bacterium RBG_13_39_9]|uniref:Uncharacterized protein n=1 Tax=Candidatus Buchananbacteria bacterium RBG_13_39_9 TaxID=1797531 RepID=A0A1G1XMP1_9BACT|nr:MAG: hypothetical protein A2Y67_00590 [Candidatus Buchananbacteria bacterium RBG_13_39_9]
METNEDFIKRKNVDFSRKELIPLKDVGRKGKYYFEREKWTFMPQHNLSNKVFCIERLKLVEIEGETTHTKLKIGDIEYRFGYYIVGKIGRAKDKWWWGQSCPIIPAKDFKKLIQQAEDENTLLI